MEESKNPKLYSIRHSMAHIMAQAVQSLFPGVKLGFGPPTDQGFFYDFDFGEKHLQESDLKKIEKAMKKIIGQKQPFTRSELNFSEALEKLKNAGEEPYKDENIQNLKDRGETRFSFYENGPFLDLCDGPHVEHTGELPADGFKLDRIAGAYWLGDEKRKMLTRIYALCFEDREGLQNYLKRREMAEKFDHKKLGKELEIFRIDPMVGKGLILWLPNGTAIRDAIEDYAKELEFKYGYRRVVTPHVTKEELYKVSQHIPAYLESMYPALIEKDDESGQDVRYYLKPMNCPHHHLIYRSRKRSYRELPFRIAEYGQVYRYEKSGELSGLIRVRGMAQNDAHIYMRPDQIEEEFRKVMNLHMEFYNAFKLKDYTFRLSIRGEANKDKFKGDASMWDEGERVLKSVMDNMKLPYVVGEGEAAFYGPKIDVQFKNLMGREETVSTIQLDYLSPENFELEYVGADGASHRPVIIHRAPLSTHERFISFLLEYYGGAFPTWCAPVQVCLIPVGEKHHAYCQDLMEQLLSHRVRVEWDVSDQSFGKKIRQNTMAKIPILLIIGDKEVDENKVTVRRYGVQEQQTLEASLFVTQLTEEIDSRQNTREPLTANL